MSNEQYLGTDSVGNKYFGSWYEDENDRGWNVRIERNWDVEYVPYFKKRNRKAPKQKYEPKQATK